VNKGDLVHHRSDNKRFYVILGVKKYYHGFYDRVRVLCPSNAMQLWFLKEDLEVLNEKI